MFQGIDVVRDKFCVMVQYHINIYWKQIKHSSTDKGKLNKQQQHDIGLERMNSPSI